MPVEHEQLHRKLVDRLVDGGLIKAGEGGRLIVEREGQLGIASSPAGAEPARRAVGEGQ